MIKTFSKGFLDLITSATRFYDGGTTRWMTRDWIREAGGINVYGYAWSRPSMVVDPLGLDGMYVSFPGYAVDTGISNGFGGTMHLPIGHAGVIAINPSTGIGTYYDFGRYGGPYGDVRGGIILANKIIYGPDGLGTQASQIAMAKEAASLFGKGMDPVFSYSQGADAQAIEAFALDRQQNPEAHPYSLNLFGKNPFNVCHTFARDAFNAGRRKWMESQTR